MNVSEVRTRIKQAQLHYLSGKQRPLDPIALETTSSDRLDRFPDPLGPRVIGWDWTGDGRVPDAQPVDVESAHLRRREAMLALRASQRPGFSGGIDNPSIDVLPGQLGRISPEHSPEPSPEPLDDIVPRRRASPRRARAPLVDAPVTWDIATSKHPSKRQKKPRYSESLGGSTLRVGSIAPPLPLPRRLPSAYAAPLAAERANEYAARPLLSPDRPTESWLRRREELRRKRK